MNIPQILHGSHHTDNRGNLTFNNNFGDHIIKKFYTIENATLEFVRGWQGHQVEQRWFSAVLGSFNIKLIKIDNWENPSANLPVTAFTINSKNFDILHVPAGYISAIQALEVNSKLLVFGDYQLNEIQDEFRFSLDYFNFK